MNACQSYPSRSDAWKQLLGQVPWQYMLTLTTKYEHRDAMQLAKIAELALDEWQREQAILAGLVIRDPRKNGRWVRGLLANRWKRGKSRAMWAIAVECGDGGRLHVHALVRSDPRLALDPELGVGIWQRILKQGDAKCEPVFNVSAAVDYVLKNADKDAVITCCRALRWQPPQPSAGPIVMPGITALMPFPEPDGFESDEFGSDMEWEDVLDADDDPWGDEADAA